MRLNVLFAIASASILSVTMHVSAAQTCNPNIAASTPDSRFTVHADETVTDNVTGLMWKRCPEGASIVDSCATGLLTFNGWYYVLQQAKNVNAGTGFAGYFDWRVPNAQELSSLVEVKCAQPSINLTIFPNTPATWFPSSSPVAGDVTNVWGVLFLNGTNGSLGTTSITYLRLVRGGR